MPGTSRTKLVLAESMKQLLKKLPLEKISVSDIVEQADIGRNTFYYHFQDKYDLVIWIFQTETAPLFAEGCLQQDWSCVMRRLEEYFRQNREFYCNALAYDGQNSLREYLFDLSKDIFVQQLRDRETAISGELSPYEMDFIGEFVASALQGILVRWAQRGMKELPEEYRSSVEKMFRGSWMHRCLEEEYPAQPGK